MKHSVRSGPDIASQDCALAARGDVITAAANAATPISIETTVAAWRTERRKGWSFTTRDFDHPARRMSRPTVPRAGIRNDCVYDASAPLCASMVRLAMTDSQAKPGAKVSPLKGPMTPVDRRALLTALGGAAIATMAQPLSAHAQARQPMRRIGVLTWWSEYDPEGQSQAVALAQGLAKLGWTEGVNVKIEYRRVFGESERIDSYATQLVNHQPDLLVGVATPAVTALLRATRTIPVVFTEVSDPIGSGFVQTLARPGGNATGFVDIEASIGGKWVELLKEISPALKRVGFMFNPKTAPGAGAYYLPPFEAAARASGIEPVEAPVRDPADVVAAFGGLA
jgi:hypothetical protein